jgi:hypothetical protein
VVVEPPSKRKNPFALALLKVVQFVLALLETLPWGESVSLKRNRLDRDLGIRWEARVAPLERGFLVGEDAPSKHPSHDEELDCQLAMMQEYPEDDHPLIRESSRFLRNKLDAVPPIRPG